MEVSEFQLIKHKTVVGLAALIGRTFILQIITFVATFILTIILNPAAFGVYFVVTAIISILNYFSDIGLAAALIQKREEPKREDYVTTFTLQQSLVITAIAVFFIFSSRIAEFFSLNNDGLWLLRALLISFFFSSLKTIPTIILERRLDFGLKVIPQILETFTFYTVAIVLAMKGFGILCFAYAAILRGLVGLIAIYIISPWKIGFGFSAKSARALLSFGIPLQGGSMLALVKDDLMIVFLGKVLPKTELGFIGWAKKWSEAPLRSFMDNIIAVSFPVYARISHDKGVLRSGIEKTLFFSGAFIFPSILGLMLVMKPVVHVIPHYTKWSMGLFSFYLFSISALLASLSSPLVQTLNALGKAKTTFVLMLLWTALTWILIPSLIYLVGFNGVSIAAVIISVTAFLPAAIVKRYVDFSFFQPLIKPVLGTLIMVAFIYPLITLLQSTIIGVISTVVTGIAIYTVFMYLTCGNDIKPYIDHLRHSKNF